MASGDEHLLTCMTISSEGSLVSLAVLVPISSSRWLRA
jgi:hypothetical protein